MARLPLLRKKEKGIATTYLAAERTFASLFGQWRVAEVEGGAAATLGARLHPSRSGRSGAGVSLVSSPRCDS